MTSIAWFFRGYSAKLPEEEWLRKVVAQSYVRRIGEKKSEFWKDAFGNAQGVQEISQAVVVAKLVAFGSCSYHRSSHVRRHLPAAWGMGRCVDCFVRGTSVLCVSGEEKQLFCVRVFVLCVSARRRAIDLCARHVFHVVLSAQGRKRERSLGGVSIVSCTRHVCAGSLSCVFH